MWGSCSKVEGREGGLVVGLGPGPGTAGETSEDLATGSRPPRNLHSGQTKFEMWVWVPTFDIYISDSEVSSLF